MRSCILFPWLGVVEFPAREATSWRRRESSTIERVFFSLFKNSSYRFSIFSRSNAHTHTRKEGAKTRGKAEGPRKRAVRFTRFLDYRLIFDSGCSFSLKYYLIRSPYPFPRIVDSLTSHLISVLFPPAF